MASGATADPASEPDRIGNKIVVVLLGLLVTLAAAGAGGALMLKPATAHTGTGSAARPPAGAEAAVATYATLPTMNFTLSDGRRLRELRVRAVLELDPSIPLDSVKPHLPRIADAMNLRMLDVAPDELRGPDGTHYIKDALRFAADKAMRPLKVRQVLVQDMLLR
ncbi:flagellar FliL protein [Azospirillum agricola]|uniref:flagellar basal body-associated FliL family protein n=1 Tax=Azospirillum agricola TaxID=1720247 RepID=UPI001AE399EA|nr:flagellar basal body-associated FliL family protein [Azospirillum agricola]MBP2226866.1 flagellar FliL protein [Azospirillum agricola]